MATMLDRLLNFVGLEPGATLPQQRALRGVPGQGIGVMGEVVAGLNDHRFYDRSTRYADYEMMDQHAFINSALDIYRNEATQRSPQTEKSVWIETRNPTVRRILNKFLRDIKIEENVETIAREVAKYGDLPVFPIVEGDKGITDLIWVHPSTVEPITDPNDGHLIGYACDALERISPEGGEILPVKERGREEEGFSPWDFVWFKVGNMDMEQRHFGRSMVEAARSSWRDLTLLEVAIALHRIHSVGAHRIYNIDVGDASADEARAIAMRWQTALKRNEYLGAYRVSDAQNPGLTGDSSSDINSLMLVLQRYRPFSMHDDIFWPKRRDSQSSIDFHEVSADIKAIEDIEHFSDMMRVALKVPKAYFEGEISGFQANTALAQQDIQFARMILPLQRGIINGITELCVLHLIYMDTKIFNFKVRMETPSYLLEKQYLENMAERISIARDLYDASDFLPVDKEKWAEYLLTHVLRIPEVDLNNMRSQGEPREPDSTGGDDRDGEPKEPESEENQVIAENERILPFLSHVETRKEFFENAKHHVTGDYRKIVIGALSKEDAT